MQEDIKKSFLEKEKIGTMEKDLQRLREKTAEKERQEMMGRAEKEHMKNIPGKKTFSSFNDAGLSQDIKKPISDISQQQTESGLKKGLQKLSIRIIFIFIILAVVGGLIFLFYIKGPKEIETILPIEETQETQKPLIAPMGILETNYLNFINIDSPEVINQSIEYSFYNKFESFGFHRVLFKKNEEEFFTDKEILSALNIFPIEVMDLFNNAIEGNFVFFIYNNGLSKRPGFVIKIGDENQGKIKQEMKKWESNTESAMLPMLLIIGEPRDKYYTTKFKETSFLSEKIRFQTLSQNDYGICYTATNDYLILTTSIESIRKVVSILSNKI